VRFAFADALDLGGVQRIDFLAALVLALLSHPPRQHEGMGEGALPVWLSLDLAHDVACDPAEVSAARWARLNCLAWA
jgi:hypothetical protein